MKAAFAVSSSVTPSPPPSSLDSPPLSLVILLCTNVDKSELITPLCWSYHWGKCATKLLPDSGGEGRGGMRIRIRLSVEAAAVTAVMIWSGVRATVALQKYLLVWSDHS